MELIGLITIIILSTLSIAILVILTLPFIKGLLQTIKFKIATFVEDMNEHLNELSEHRKIMLAKIADKKNALKTLKTGKKLDKLDKKINKLIAEEPSEKVEEIIEEEIIEEEIIKIEKPEVKKEIKKTPVETKKVEEKPSKVVEENDQEKSKDELQ